MLKTGAQYKWPSDSQFTLNNEQFGILYNGLSAIVSTPAFQAKVVEAQQTLSIVQLQQTMNDVLENAVSQGIATEVSNEGTPANSQG